VEVKKTDDRSDYALYQILYGTQGTSLQMDIYREAVGGIMNMGFMECNSRRLPEDYRLVI
jgi:hypothetical protein